MRSKEKKLRHERKSLLHPLHRVSLAGRLVSMLKRGQGMGASCQDQNRSQPPPPPIAEHSPIFTVSPKGAAGMAELAESTSSSHGSNNQDENLSLATADQIRRPESSCLKRRSLKVTTSALRVMIDLERTVKAERFKEWAAIFRRADPRYRILTFFQDVAHEGASKMAQADGFHPERSSPLLKAFDRASTFSVWRPTSNSSIVKLMTKQAVGKGLDIKGKSAKSGKLSAFVPFLQIHEERHKRMIRTLPKDAMMRMFYQSKEHRDAASEELVKVAEEMVEGYFESRKVLADESADEESREAAMECFMWEMTHPEIIFVDDCAAQNAWGVEIPERLFWEAYVMRKDISRTSFEYDTKRPSSPSFQDMNFAALHHGVKGDLRPVVWQYSTEDPMCPLNLLMAYEEKGRVLPTVSDFDCFLVGTRGVTFKERLPPNQVEMLQREVDSIEGILDSPPTADSWTTRWLEVLKEQPSMPEMPKYGFGDPQSYRIMKHAIKRLNEDGSVRHGAECFNYYFPQELDDKFLVISDSLPGKVPWKYVDAKGLREFLIQKADDGYTFPLNVKWLLCDPGWKAVYDKLLESDKPNVRDSMNVWFPPQSGLREQIERIHTKHPNGFIRDKEGGVSKYKRVPEEGNEEEHDGTAAMDLAELELKRYRTLQRAKKKLSVALFMMKHMSSLSENLDQACLSPSKSAIANSVRKKLPILKKSVSIRRIMVPALDENDLAGAAVKRANSAYASFKVLV